MYQAVSELSPSFLGRGWASEQDPGYMCGDGRKPRERRPAGVSAEGCMLAKEHQVLWVKENLIQSLEELEVTSLADSPGGDESGTGLWKMAN